MPPATGTALIILVAFVLPGFVTVLIQENTYRYTEAPTPLDRLLRILYYSVWTYLLLGLAALVFTASFAIPFFKLAGLVWCIASVVRRSTFALSTKTKTYRAVEEIGRWSMVDIFVDTFTVALIQLQPLMYVKPNRGIFFFAAVVILTMLAVQSFDPRLIWDPASSKEVQHV